MAFQPSTPPRRMSDAQIEDELYQLKIKSRVVSIVGFGITAVMAVGCLLALSIGMAMGPLAIAMCTIYKCRAYKTEKTELEAEQQKRQTLVADVSAGRMTREAAVKERPALAKVFEQTVTPAAETSVVSPAPAPAV